MLSSEFVRNYTTSQRSNNPFEKQCFLFEEGLSMVERQMRQAFIEQGKNIEEVKSILNAEAETPNDAIIEKYGLIIDFEGLLKKLEI